LDRYDNDGAGLHPYVMLLQNDGTKKFNAEHEHGVHKEHDESELELGGCTLHARNLVTPSTLRVTYFNNRLTVSHARTHARTHELARLLSRSINAAPISCRISNA
jgi:hypothetical protein